MSRVYKRLNATAKRNRVYKRLNTTAKRLQREYDPSTREGLTEIAIQKYGVKRVITTPLAIGPTALEYREGEVYIFYPPFFSRKLERFAIAHEIGHVVAGFECEDAENKANYFAEKLTNIPFKQYQREIPIEAGLQLLRSFILSPLNLLRNNKKEAKWFQERGLEHLLKEQKMMVSERDRAFALTLAGIAMMLGAESSLIDDTTAVIYIGIGTSLNALAAYSIVGTIKKIREYTQKHS